MGEITPYNRIENFLAKGSGADVAPYNRLERILAGEDLEPTNRLEYFAKEAASGGGNPNRVQTITGTLAEPWGDVGFDALFEALPLYHDDTTTTARNATAIIRIDGTSLGMGSAKLPLHSYESGLSDFIYGDGIAILAKGFLAAEGGWKKDGICEANIYTGSSQDWTYTETDIEAYASAIPTTLTIIWHPLPDNG